MYNNNEVTHLCVFEVCHQYSSVTKDADGKVDGQPDPGQRKESHAHIGMFCALPNRLGGPRPILIIHGDIHFTYAMKKPK